jgi:hypothetical protein
MKAVDFALTQSFDELRVSVTEMRSTNGNFRGGRFELGSELVQYVRDLSSKEAVRHSSYKRLDSCQVTGQRSHEIHEPKQLGYGNTQASTGTLCDAEIGLKLMRCLSSASSHATFCRHCSNVWHLATAEQISGRKTK